MRRTHPVAWTLAALLAALLGVSLCATVMPGRNPSGHPQLPPEDRKLRDDLRAEVQVFSERIGERNLAHPSALEDAANHLQDELSSAGYQVRALPYAVPGDRGPLAVRNLEAELRGGARAREIVVIGAHYDTVEGTPGADDNASGVAVLLHLARAFSRAQPSRTLRFVAFVNEEPPFFRTDLMGSEVYARSLSARGEQVVAMLSLESIGYFSDARDSQKYPFPLSAFYPSTGNFIGFVGNVSSMGLVRTCTSVFRARSLVPSEGAALPGLIPGVGWSDQWAFWRHGYPAAMVTGTAPFRNPNYHRPSDLPQTLDYDRLAMVARGLEDVARALADPK